MEFLELIKNCTDEELEPIVKERIKFLEEFYEGDLDNIGYQVDCNPSISDFNINDYFDYGVLCIYRGYIPKNTKITYGVTSDFFKGLAYNEGCYYYLDDDDYVIDFCKYIKNRNILDEFDLFDYTLLFLENYFGYIKKDISRSEMFKMICNEDGTFYNPIDEHKFSSFKKRGNAVCSEYAIAAQNILSIFGFDMYIVIGAEGVNEKEIEAHAFNLITYKEEETKEEINALMDFSNTSLVMNIKFQRICKCPFIGYIDKIDDEFIDDFIYGNKHLVFDDTDYILFSNNVIRVTNGRKRDYFVDVAKQKEYTKK